MASERTLTIKILGDATGAQKALGTLDNATDKTSSKFASFAKSAAIAFGATAVLKFGKDSIAAFKESEDAQSKLQAAFAKFPALANANIEGLRALNTELAKKTKYDDDATASGQAVLAGFNLTAEQLRTLTPLLQDYATRTGKDLPTASQDLGKAILGQGRALKAIGVDFKDTGSEAGNFAQLTDVLRDKVGGFAEKEGKTASGQAQILKNQFGELQEKVGSVLVPVLTRLANVLLTVVEFFQNLSPEVQAAIGVVAGLAVGVLAINKAIAAWAAVQTALNAVLLANPIVLVVAGIAALVAGLVLAYQQSETFRNIVDGAFRAVGTAAVAMKDVALGAIRFLVDTWLAQVEWIVKAGAKAFGWLPRVGDDIQRAARDVEKFRDDVNKSLGGIKDKEVKVTFKGGGGGDFGGRGASGGWGDGEGLENIGSIGKGYQAAIASLKGSGIPYGVSSTTRPFAMTSSGNPSLHAIGKAVDFTGPNKGAIANWFLQQASSLRELIYTPLGFSIKNGQRVAPIAASDHYDHVHVGTYHSGGIVGGGPDGAEVLARLQVGEGVIDRNTMRSAGTGSDVAPVVNNYFSINVGGSVTSETDLVDRIHEGLLKLQRRNGTLGLV